MRLIDLSGAKLGRLEVLYRCGTAKNGDSTWSCLCDCGKRVTARGELLRSGKTRSCGCLRSDMFSTHKQSKTRIYRTWIHMRERCLNPRCKSYLNYGGRGIKVCEEWGSFESFRDWSLENGYRDDLSIDRKDVNGNYEPSNCRWADDKTQGNNRRNNHRINYRGETKTVSEWADCWGVNYDAVMDLVKRGKPMEQIAERLGAS